MQEKNKKYEGSGFKTPRKVWIVEDDRIVNQYISSTLKREGYEVKTFHTVADFESHMEKEQPDNQVLLLLDYFLSDITALDIVQKIRKPGQPLHFLIMTGGGDERTAVEIMKAGAIDYLIKEKGFFRRVHMAVDQAFEHIQLKTELEASRLKLQKSIQKQKELNARITRQNTALEVEKAEKDRLLRNILPEKIARELMDKGTAKARYYEKVTVMFADVEAFSSKSVFFTPIELVEKLDEYFCAFDTIIEQQNLEKIKTIGDCYMCAGGLPLEDPLHPFKVVLAGLHIQELVKEMGAKAHKKGKTAFELRLGIHTGEVVAGVIGRKKFAYDIWGNAANLASWMVMAGEGGKVNISKNTHDLVGDLFECTPRGNIPVKNEQAVPMFFVNKIVPGFFADKKGLQPNRTFWQKASLISGLATEENKS